MNVRYVAGGSEGTNPDATPPGDGYSKNWAQFMAISLGFYFEPLLLTQ